MILRMPVVFGSSSYAKVVHQIAVAVSARDYPIELDCEDIVLVTSSFYTMVIAGLRSVGMDRSKVLLTNVGDKTLDMIKTCKFDQVINIRMKDNG